jgi:uncharacterized protein YceK
MFPFSVLLKYQLQASEGGRVPYIPQYEPEHELHNPITRTGATVGCTTVHSQHGPDNGPPDSANSSKYLSDFARAWCIVRTSPITTSILDKSQKH